MLNSFRDTRKIEVLTLSDATIEEMNTFLRNTEWRISLDPDNFVNHYDALLGVLRLSTASPFDKSNIILTRKHHVVKIKNKIVGAYDDEEFEELFLN